MSGYIEDKISIYVDVRELAKPHKNLIVDKIVENLSDFDPYYDELYFYLRSELEDEDGNYDEDQINHIQGEYSSYGHDALVENYFTINEEEMYFDVDECDLENGVVCIVVPFTFALADFADEYI